jgi:ATP-binding cassette subfamily B protein
MPVTQLSSMANTIQLTIASAERVFELLDEAEEPADPVPARRLAGPRGGVSIDRMSFSYKADAPLIEDMSIEVAPGQTVAIVGHTGAGKTTLVNLLMRFYDVNAGAIRVDGVDIRDMTRGDLRKVFGMVLQDTWLFSGTIRDNIAYGRQDASGDDIVRAARAAHADHFVRTLPENYDTIVNEEATNLSQGQKQLLTIARAFVADPAILILDEATSSVDTRTEVLIQKAMAQLMHGRTTFVIAHRLSTIRNADLILMMEHGRIVEKGTHEGLLAAGSRYAELYRSQFSNRAVTSA